MSRFWRLAFLFDRNPSWRIPSRHRDEPGGSTDGRAHAKGSQAGARASDPVYMVGWGGPGFPLGYLKVSQVMLWVSLMQVALAVLLFVFFRSQEGRWFFAARDRRAFSWGYALVGVLTAVVLFILTVGLAIFIGLAGELETVSGGMKPPDGIYLLERRFQAGDREVRLAGMMHIAEEEFYTDLLPARRPTAPLGGIGRRCDR